MVELGNMIVMDSLDYFLGLINEDEEGSEGDEEEEICLLLRNTSKILLFFDMP